MNWPHILRSLVKSGMTQPQIAAVCQCGQSTLSELLHGKTRDPRYSLAASLIKLAADRGIDLGPVQQTQEVRDAA